MKRAPSLLLTALLALPAAAQTTQPAPSPGGLPTLKSFPIAVWLQSPENAPKFQAIGINLYVGLWEGPTADQLAALEKVHMPVICEQNAEGLKPRWKDEIVAWMQDDEPDNAQSLPNDKGYGPPILPSVIQDIYKKMKTADPARPVMLNLGQGVAWDDYYGRGTRTNKPEDYPQYALGGDILSFDIYPMCSPDKPVAGKPEFVGRGVDRLLKAGDNKKPAWACIECTHISNPEKIATPAQVKCEVWLAITHGATGIIYFVHQFAPKFVEAGLIQDPKMTAAVKDINAQIQSLAPALGNPAPVPPATLQSNPAISLLTRKAGTTTYVFAVNASDAKTSATFTHPAAGAKVEVVDEARTLTPQTQSWTDTFAPFEVHIYRLP